jgi:transposase
MKITTIGLDLAKAVFHVIGLDERGKEVVRRKLRRSQVARYFANLAPCRIGIEACGGAHYWARKLQGMGHQVDLIPAQHVKPLVMGNKNDANDARAIAEALGRPKIHFVAVKTQAQQDLQAVQRLRLQCVKDRTALCNGLRGLLSEYGIVLSQGVSTVRKGIPSLLEDAQNGLSHQRLLELDGYIQFYTRELEQAVGQDEDCRRLQTIPGFGAVVTGAFVTVVGDGHAFRRGRDVSAILGLVPAQHSSAGKDRLLGISKRGDRQVRCVLVQGARSVVMRATGKEDRLSRWINRIRQERGTNKAVVALANKMARMAWAILAHGRKYDRSYVSSAA